ncbi:MAG: ATPase domain-containing protein [SAR202 cluster bacterium]|nr:ATPase domain-containing protein [SAR202 cluster bacterium]
MLEQFDFSDIGDEDDFLPDKKADSGLYEGTRIPTGNDWMDRTLRGGIPLRSVTLIEGPSDSGKSVMLQHLTSGALLSDLLVAYYSSKGGLEKIADQMLSLGLDVFDDLESEQLRIFDLDKVAGPKKDASLMLENLVDDVVLRTIEGVDVVVFDDLTWPISHANPNDSISLLMRCKELARRGLTILTAMHTSAYDEELSWRLNKLFDSHISLVLEGQKRGYRLDVVNLMKLKKVENLVPTGNDELYFRVNPELGASMNISLDVMPIFKIQV